MKRIVCFLLSLFCLCSLCACGNTSENKVNNRVSSNTNTVQDVLEKKGEGVVSAESMQGLEMSDELKEKMEEMYNKKKEDNETIESPTVVDVDVDLTTLSSTMVYSEVYNMLTNPNEYMDKVVKMTGVYSPFYSSDTNITYHNLIIKDATACCQQGLEFKLANGNYPTDKEGEEFTVIGTFSTYLENGYYYVTLKDAYIV